MSAIIETIGTDLACVLTVLKYCKEVINKTKCQDFMMNLPREFDRLDDTTENRHLKQRVTDVASTLKHLEIIADSNDWDSEFAVSFTICNRKLLIRRVLFHDNNERQGFIDRDNDVGPGGPDEGMGDGVEEVNAEEDDALGTFDCNGLQTNSLFDSIFLDPEAVEKVVHWIVYWL